MGEVAKTLVSYLADVEARGHPAGTDRGVGPTAMELTAADSMLLQLLRAHQGLRHVEEANSANKIALGPSTELPPLRSEGYWYSWGAIHQV